MDSVSGPAAEHCIGGARDREMCVRKYRKIASKWSALIGCSKPKLNVKAVGWPELANSPPARRQIALFFVVAPLAPRPWGLFEARGSGLSTRFSDPVRVDTGASHRWAMDGGHASWVA